MKNETRAHLIAFHEAARWKMAHEIYALEMKDQEGRDFHLKCAEIEAQKVFEHWDALEAEIDKLEKAAECCQKP